MSQLIYPSLPGALFPARTVVAPPVTIKTTPSRREFRSRDSSIPLYRYSVAYDFLRVGSAYAEYQTLLGFFNRVGGTFDDWLFPDPDDNTATAELFALGDGSTVAFQLGRTLGGFFEPVFGPGSGLTFTVGGGAVTPTSIGNTGLVTFSAAPAAAAQIRWSGPFFYRCRFANETLDFMRSYATFLEAKKVEFMTVKPV